MTPSKILFLLCLSFVVGIGGQSFFSLPQFVLWGFLFGAAFLAVLFGLSLLSQKKTAVLVVAFCVVCFVLGASRLELFQVTANNDPLRHFNDTKEKVEIIGTVSSEPDARGNFQRLRVSIDGTKSIVLVSVKGRYDYRYLDRLSINGYLKTPAVFDDFHYKNYLLKEGIYSVMDSPDVVLVSRGRPDGVFSWWRQSAIFIKRKLSLSMHENFSSRDSAILEGVLFGINKNISSDLNQKISIAGLRHLTAVSGLHIVIISGAIFAVLMSAGFWRQYAFYLAVILVWTYVAAIGFPPSGTRAAIMGSLMLIAQNFGRQHTSSRAIFFAASLMLFINPFLLRHDIGFQLSFMASMGIIYAKPFFDWMTRPIKEHFKKPKILTRKNIYLTIFAASNFMKDPFFI